MDGRRNEWRFLVKLFVVFSVAELFRHAFVETRSAASCELFPWDSVFCAARSTVILFFQHQAIGWAGLACSVYATLTRRLAPAQLGLFMGVAGLVLYSFVPAVWSVLLGGLVWTRYSGAPRTALQG